MRRKKTADFSPLTQSKFPWMSTEFNQVSLIWLPFTRTYRTVYGYTRTYIIHIAPHSDVGIAHLKIKAENGNLAHTLSNTSHRKISYQKHFADSYQEQQQQTHSVALVKMRICSEGTVYTHTHLLSTTFFSHRFIHIATRVIINDHILFEEVWYWKKNLNTLRILFISFRTKLFVASNGLIYDIITTKRELAYVRRDAHTGWNNVKHAQHISYDMLGIKQVRI